MENEFTTAAIKKTTLEKVKKMAENSPLTTKQLLDVVVNMGLDQLREKSEVTINLNRDEEIERRR